MIRPLQRQKCLGSWLLVVAACLQPAGVHAQSALEESVRNLVARHEGETAVAIRHVPSQTTVLIDPDRPMPTASLIKVAVMIEAYRRADQEKLDLSRQVTVREEDKVPGSGILTAHFSSGMQITIRDAIRLMMAFSDNTATNLVVDQLGLPTISACMESLGCPNTRLHAKVFRGDTSIAPERSREFGLGSTTAREMLSLLERLHKGELATATATSAMLDHLRACDSKHRLPRLLPAGTKVAHKTGSVSAVRTDAGIIESPAGPIIVVLLTAKNKDQRWTQDNAAERLSGELAKLVYDHFNPESGKGRANQPVELDTGSAGWLVEALQRTLNHRLDPSPNLSVDGDFGPATKAAVVRFQESRKLTATGIVNAPTWQALGALVTSDAAITDPAQFNLTLEAPRPADSLEGLPFVSCPGWVIGDAQSAEVLQGAGLDTPRPNASTTKLMTALITLRELRKSPELGEQLIAVSDRADQTIGSTAELKGGERVSVRDLLFGLLLPSGNDASIVLAEFLGSRFPAAQASAEPADPVELFVGEMNRVAQQLGMSQTTFMNPHGLSAAGHQSTPRDLLKLAATLVGEEDILPYVRTRKHVGRVESISGYTRYQLWTNTNHLLDIEGYLGLKTGTTEAAGACLVSLGERNGRRLIVVVLGSAGSESRYTDTRNLFRWAWQNL